MNAEWRLSEQRSRAFVWARSTSRNGKANIKDSYGIIKNNELYILNMHISKYENSGVFSPDELRTRKLLVHKKENEKCLICKNLIKKDRINGRSTYYCSNCQK